MQTVEEYLKREFRPGKLRLERIYESLIEISKTFRKSYLTKYAGWYYEFPGEPPDKTRTGEPWYSPSTQAMCAFALNRITTAAFWYERENKEEDLREAILENKKSCIQNLCSWLNGNATKGKVWTSDTYGDEDPLTASWIVELLSAERHSLNSSVSEKLTNAIYNALDGEFDQIIADENRAGAHAFPVYRLVLAAKKIWKDANKWDTAEKEWQPLLSKTGYWFEQGLHRQLSHYHINDFRFDAPELIYCLAGTLQTNHLSTENPLIPEVLEVIRAAQQRSVYWRPYRPFLVKPQGLVLMPLTVEVADALLDTLDVTGHFGQLSESLSNYYDWLMTQKIEKGIKEDNNVVNVIGWRSENAFSPPKVEKIHTWTTSRVAMFLLNYSRLLDRTLQSDLLSHSGLSIKETRDLLAWEDIQPMDLGCEKQLKQVIEEYFITPHESTLNSQGKRLNPNGSFSMFLYGPPGTSKTSLAEGVARKLGLKLVTITVSDFIVSGEQAVEERAKIIFEMLSELKNVVVLFDEIDRLIIDRDSERYLQQRDILQMMTPSMLTKLNDLKRKGRLIFVIATNYFERIDKAIKRRGRIDWHFFIPPFNQESRVALIEYFIRKCKELGEEGTDWQPPTDYKRRLSDIANAKDAPLLVFEDLKGVFDRSKSGVNRGDIGALLDNLEREIRQVKPFISIGSYESRFRSELDPEKPYREFFFLCCMLAEADQADAVRERFKKCWEEWKKNEENDREVRELTSDTWVRKQLPKLGVTMDESQPGVGGRKSPT